MPVRTAAIPRTMSFLPPRAARAIAAGAVRARAVAACAVAAGAIAACSSLPPAPPEPPAPARVDAGAAVPVPGAPDAQRAATLPPIPGVDGPLRLEVAYPADSAAVAVRDSTFLFGSTGTGRAVLTINGAFVDVAPNGAFLAFLPVPADGVYLLRATLDGEVATLERRVELPAAPDPAPVGAVAIVPGSGYPSGALAAPTGEAIEIGFRGTRGGLAALVLPTGERIPMVELGAHTEVFREGDQFRTQVGARAGAGVARYAGVLPAQPLVAYDTAVARPRIGSVVPMPSRLPVTDTAGPTIASDSVARSLARTISTDARFELILGPDTARVPLRLNLAVIDPHRPHVGVAWPPPGAAWDWRIRGRHDVAGPFHFFWPAGTRLHVTAQRDGMLRLRLAGARAAWVPAADVQLLPAGAPPPAAIVWGARFDPQPGYIDLRVPIAERLPFHVEQQDHTLHLDIFGAISRINFFQYGRLDPLIRFAEWSQPHDSVLRFSIQLDAPVWGYETFFDASDALILRIRRPPPIDSANPLRGLRIAVDAGHGGADRTTRGPTGLTEADANLMIAHRLRDLLQQRGADVVMTRTVDATVDLGDRPRMAAEAHAHILISIHNNAFPDGVNPWVNNGTSVYYYHPHSADLARLVQLELLQELGLRDIGIGRADLALARPTWMPAILSETMYLMIPQQEAALRDPDVHDRIARAHVRALDAFLRRHAAR